MEILFKLYAVGAVLAFLVYVTLFLNDRTTPLGDRASWLVLLMATALWPLVLPISLKTELLPRLRRWSRSSRGDRLNALETVKSGEGRV